MAKRNKKTKIPKSMRKQYRDRKLVKKALDRSREQLMQKTKDQMGCSKIEFRIESPGKAKMSQTIIDFAQPLLEVSKNKDDERKALILAIAIWNLSLQPQDILFKYKNEIKRNLYKTDEMNKLSEPDEDVLNYMIERKNWLFENIKRMVVDYELIDTPKGLHLNVVSAEVNDGLQ